MKQEGEKMGRGGDFTACGRAPRKLMLGTHLALRLLPQLSPLRAMVQGELRRNVLDATLGFIEYAESPPACFLCPGTKYHAALGTFPTSYRSQPTITDYP